MIFCSPFLCRYFCWWCSIRALSACLSFALASAADQALGDLTSFNLEHGYLEALVRGFRTGFLREYEYRQLTQCEVLDDVKVTLGDTDYNTTLQSTTKLTPEIIVDKCWEKFVEEFEHLRSQAVGPLNTFLNMITYEYMIDNVSFLITSLVKGGEPSVLLGKCDPLGKFPRMKSVSTFENNEDGLFELYR
jgi:V-type H+-transporting ATPase subunit d